MIIDGTSDRLEDRLAQLARLHATGELDDGEYRSAKAQLLESGPPASASTSTVASTRVITIGSLHWWAWLIVAVVLGFITACLGAAWTPLQRPAGPVLCNAGTFVIGNTSQQSIDGTGYNFDSSCVAPDGAVHQVSGVGITMVLWLEYTVAIFVVLMLVVGLTRALRSPRLKVDLD